MGYLKKANEFYLRGDYSKAIKAYKNYSEIDNENIAEYLYNIGVCYIKLKDYNNGILYTQKSLLYGETSKRCFNLGYCLALLNKYDEALIEFKKAQKLDSLDEDTKKAIDILISKGAKVKEEINLDKLTESTNYFDILTYRINNALDIGNKELFIKLANEYNKIRAEYII